MRTSKYFRYLTAMIIALGTSFNVFAQERNLKIYFNEYVSGETTPRMYVTDDHPNSGYDVPLGVTVSQEGATWAGTSRFFEWVTVSVTDRVIADFVSTSDKKHSKLKLSFTSFPYEINTIQWNVMNDLLSGSVTNWFQNYNVTTKCVPVSGNGFSYTEENWSMNIFTHSTTFNQGDIPWQSGATLNGLRSFEISEKYETKVGVGSWTWWDVGEAELNDKNRTFIKAGWNGKAGTESNINDDDENWAFKVKFTLPDIRLRFADGRSGYIINTDETNVKLLGEITAHAGAVVPTDNPQDPDDFHYEFSESSNGQIIELGNVKYLGRAYKNGTITAIKKAGTVDVTVRLMRGNREVTSYTQTITVRKYSVSADSPQIAIAFADGNKGYDVTVGDANAQIQGVITKSGKDDFDNTVSTTTATNNPNGYHFEYTSANDDIATIDRTTGKITAKKDGDVNISAVLMNGNTAISKQYTYTLHVFAKHEGLEFRRINTYHYSDASNQYEYTEYILGWPVTRSADRTTWNVGTTSSNANYDWKSNNLLRVNTSINNTSDYGVNDWKQIASFSTGEYSYWRAICQEIAFDVYVPKYTKSVTQYSFAGNAAIGSKKTHSTGRYSNSTGDCKYGFEINYLNQKWDNGKPVNEQISLEQANTKLMDRMWNTNAAVVTETFARSGASSYTSNVGAANAIIREIDNVTSPKCNENRKLTVYFAVMSYLWNDESYPGDVSIGFKGTPEYTYYASVTYHKNDGTGAIWGTDEFNTQSKTETKALFSQWSDAPTRDGYTFMGWSTDPNSETATAEYNLHDSFSIYDTENGGGMGPVNLYAIWKANKYIVELRSLPTSNYEVYGHVMVTYDADMPSVNVDGATLTAPYIKGYDFGGYYDYANNQYTTCYYDKDMKSVHVWDKTDNLYISAKWLPHTVIVHLDADGGENYGISQFTILYGAKLPTTAEGVQKPSKNGYTFGGYFTKRNGAGTQYYMADMTVAGNGRWYVDEPEVTLYAKWIPNNYLVTLNRQGGTGGTGSVTGTYGQPLPSGKTAPTKPGYEFKGYYSSQNQEYYEAMGQDYGGRQYYDKDMNAVEPWDLTYSETIYAHWKPATFIVTLDADGGVLPNPVVEDNAENFAITKVSNSVMTIPFVYSPEAKKTHDLVHSTAKKPGYELLGWYDSNGVKVISVDEKSRNCTITDNGGYWTEGGTVWNHIGDITLKAKYRQKYQTPYENVIAFDNEKVEAGEDWLWAVVNDLVGSAQEVYQKTGQKTMIFDLRNSTNMWTGNKFNRSDVMESLQGEECVSPNLLVYFNDNGDGWQSKDCYNAISLDNVCKDLRVTDRYPIKILETFNAVKASYARDAGIVDAETQQAQKSSWGTLCLPYSVKNNTSDVQYYWLRSMTNNYMEFEEFEDDAVIPANTPVLYRRTDGDVSSRINIVETNKNVPKNMAYQAVTIDYANVGNLVEGTYPLVSADATIHEWEFRGNLQTSVFCGKDYNKDKILPAGAVQVDKGDVYYFKQNKFTHLLPRRVINGVTYAAGKMTLYPYRAYFYQKDSGSSAKVSQYSILVMGEDGTLDITDLLFGDGEGDGKIYDLSGVRVMKPVKGRLYIVNGQKKVYR